MTNKKPDPLPSHLIRIGDIKLANDMPLVLIGGPCVIESEEHALMMAEKITAITKKIKIPFIFKASFDKANRSSIHSFRGPGLKNGLKILQKVKTEFEVPVLSDVHSIEQITEAVKVLDVVQVPALLSRQTDLIVEIARHDVVVNIKKGQFLAPWDMKEVINKIESTGNKKIMLTERGTSFGYNNLVSDMRSLVVMKDFGYPVVYDATHSVQTPGGLGCASGGESRFIPVLSKSAVATGIAALFLEIHDNPSAAKCDGPNSLHIDDLQNVLEIVKKIDRLVK
jgi:2-dehydro-3-deoxyphosphooctonate aldolase (KDO 8-P synthase)